MGLELHAYRRRMGGEAVPVALGFGTTRTITLLAALGFLLWVIAPLAPFCVGLLALAGLLGLDYARRLTTGDAALLPSLIALLAYALGPFVLVAPLVVVAGLVVVVLLALGEQTQIRRFSDAFPAEEGVTLAKFLIIAGLVLPLMPARALPGLPSLSYHEVWMVAVAISALSYIGYVAHRYIWPRAGVLLTGLIGGLYSSTATTVVLGRQSRHDPVIASQAPAAILLAMIVMYLRMLALIALLGHVAAARALLLPFGVIILGSGIVALILWRLADKTTPSTAQALRLEHGNPLDLKIAFLFAGLFIFFAAVTRFITLHYGAGGLKLLSLLVGFTDINPFILSLVTAHNATPPALLVGAVLIAAVTNNLVNAVYALVLARQRILLPVVAWFALCLAAALFWTGWA